MLLYKKGFPEEGELVLCKVGKVSYNAVFVTINEYRKQGMIHISEVSPGRIRSLSNFVKEGKMVVCKVLRINKERGHIDLSLRRVNDNQKRKKMDTLKQEQRAEKIIEDSAKLLKIEVPKFYEKVSKFPLAEYGGVYPAFEAVIEEDYDLSDLELEKKELDTIMKLVKERIKPKEVEILGDIIIQSYQENGVEVVKKALIMIEKTDTEKITVKYLGASKFRLRLVAHDYQEAEAILKKGLDEAEEFCKKNKADFKFEKVQAKK
jgi:translation initiation factor 2 subunit 1